MNRINATLCSLALGAALWTMPVVGPAIAASFDDAQKAELNELIRSYLIEHPEILREMSQKLQESERQAEEKVRGAALTTQTAAIYKTTGDNVLGNPKGDVTIVEFLDYNCGWCKKSMTEMQSLIESDKNLKVIFKEFPIFGENSEYAARGALAAGMQGKYWPLHVAMFSHEGQVTKEVVDELAKAQGLDMDKFKKDMTDQTVIDTIATNYELAKSLQLNGTPAFIIDDQVVPGYLQLDGLQASIAKVRANGGCKLC